MGRPTHDALDRSRVAELYAFDEQICSLVASGLVPDGQRPSSEAPTAERAKEKTSQTSCDATGLTIAGFDEAGRGALAGPVVVGCVHFPFVASGLDPPVELVGLDDSKRLSPQKRNALCERIRTLAKWGIGCSSPLEIDRLGIVSALTLAAQRAYRAMGYGVDLLLLDRGLSLGGVVSSKPATTPPEIAFTKGDTKSLHIAAASILAKVSRDRMMARVAVRFPDYGFDHNKGYGTPGHLAALRRLGPSPFHRTSFRLG